MCIYTNGIITSLVEVMLLKKRNKISQNVRMYI